MASLTGMEVAESAGATLANRDATAARAAAMKRSRRKPAPAMILMTVPSREHSSERGAALQLQVPPRLVDKLPQGDGAAVVEVREAARAKLEVVGDGFLGSSEKIILGLDEPLAA